MANKVKLSIKEFLSIYTGYLIGEDFSIVKNGIEKIFGFKPYTFTTVECAKQFRKYLNNSSDELVEAVEELGEIKFDKKGDIMQQIESYVERFKEIIGKDYVEVDALLYKEIEQEI